MMIQGQVEALLLKCQTDNDLQIQLFEIYEKLFSNQPEPKKTGQTKLNVIQGGSASLKIPTANENLDLDTFWLALKIQVDFFKLTAIQKQK